MESFVGAEVPSFGEVFYNGESAIFTGLNFFQSFDEFDMIEDEGNEILLTRQIAVSRFNSILSLFIISSL